MKSGCPPTPSVKFFIKFQYFQTLASLNVTDVCRSLWSIQMMIYKLAQNYHSRLSPSTPSKLCLRQIMMKMEKVMWIMVRNVKKIMRNQMEKHFNQNWKKRWLHHLPPCAGIMLSGLGRRLTSEYNQNELMSDDAFSMSLWSWWS